MKVGTVVGGVKLKNAYDKYACDVLRPYLQKVEQSREAGKKKPQAKYKITKALPSAEEYTKLKNERYSVTLKDLADDAESSTSELDDEVRGWYDNLPENLQFGDKGEALSAAADTLENVSFDECPEACSYLRAVFFPSLDCSSRSDRACEAGSKLNELSAAIRSWVEDHEEDEKNGVESVEFDQDGEKVNVDIDWQALRDYADKCDELAEEITGVEFPGMFG